MRQVYRIRMISVTGMVMAVAMAFSIASANAAYITGVTIEDFSSQLTGGFNRKAAFTVDGSGFETNGTGTHSTDTDGTMWLTEGTYNGATDPLGSYPDSFIEFDLGTNYDLASTTVWNYNEVSNSIAYTQRGAKDVTISVASSTTGPFTSLGNFVFNQAPGSDTVDFGQDIAFAGADNVRLIRFDIISKHDTDGSDYDYTGLSEVRFTAIPEPASLALLTLIGVGFIVRRRFRR